LDGEPGSSQFLYIEIPDRRIAKSGMTGRTQAAHLSKMSDEPSRQMEM
jgi:hypothetical protein